VFLIIIILANILSSIFPLIMALTMHVIIQPLAIILSAISPLVNPLKKIFLNHHYFSGNLVFRPIAIIIGPITPYILALLVLLPIFVKSFVGGSISPYLIDFFLFF